MGCTKIQQFHESVAAAKKQISKWKKDPHSSFAKDFGDHTVVSVKLAKKGMSGGKNVRTPTGRLLYDIKLKKKRK